MESMTPRAPLAPAGPSLCPETPLLLPGLLAGAVEGLCVPFPECSAENTLESEISFAYVTSGIQKVLLKSLGDLVVGL